MSLKKVPVYPDLNDPSMPTPVNTFRLTNITQMQKDLEHDLATYSRTKRKYSSLFNAVNYMSTGTAVLGSVLSGTSVGLFATGVGSVAAIPLAGVSAFFGICSISAGLSIKKVDRKLQKHTAMVQLITAKLSSFRLLISKALQDSTISDDEFNNLQTDYDDYKRQKFELQKKWKPVPQVDTEVLKKQCLEEVSKKLDSVLKK